MSSTTLKPATAEQVCEVVTWASAEGAPLEIVGSGTKRGYGHPVTAGYRLDLSDLNGIELYEGAELVLVARAETPIGEVQAVLATQTQQLAFEPPDFGPLYGKAAGGGTLGGAIACNLAGPRRIKMGAARDHILGIKAVSGRGEAFKAGGRVMKNVTGYDLPKLVTGSFGTLCVFTEVTVKVLPAPEAVATLVLTGLDDVRAVQALTAAVQSAHDVSGAAHVPAGLVRGSTVAAIAAAGAAVTLVRLEGFEASVGARIDALKQDLGRFGPVDVLGTDGSLNLWREVRDVHGFLADPQSVLWRLSVAPSAGPQVMASLAQCHEVEGYFDWAGGLLWLSLSGPVDDAAATAVRAAVAEAGGGNAVLLRAPDAVRATVPVFDPLPDSLARIVARTKSGFDPRNILNPGRLGG